MDVTAGGAPGEEVLDSAEPGPGPRPRLRRWLGAGLVILAVLAGLFAFQALQPDPVSDTQASPTRTSASPTADPSLVDDSARRTYGESPRTGAQGFSLAVRVADDVVHIFCRRDIPSWAATLVTSADAYSQATFLMSPANREFGTFVVQVELTWTVDHYSYAAVTGHLEQCA